MRQEGVPMNPIKDTQLFLLAYELFQCGYDEPEPEYRFHGVRRWRFDLAWPGLKVAFEKEGGVFRGGRHTRGKGYEDDCEKYNWAALLGWTVIRCSTGQIESGLALMFLEKALDRAQSRKAA